MYKANVKEIVLEKDADGKSRASGVRLADGRVYRWVEGEERRGRGGKAGEGKRGRGRVGGGRVKGAMGLSGCSADRLAECWVYNRVRNCF